MSLGGTGSFAQEWRAEILPAPPMIAPARHFTYPRQIPGEEDALARGALLLLVHPHSSTKPDQAAGPFLATCALGFTDPSMPTGIFACPHPHELCALAGGYAYLIDTAAPDRSTHLPLKPVTSVLPLPEHGLLLFVGFHAILAWGPGGLAWHTPRLSWEGIRIVGVHTHNGVPSLHGLGWNMPTDKEVEFRVDLRTGAHTGGGY
jgi:hypothetical protein